MMFNGHFHLYYYPRLRQIMREVRPEILHIDEEPYNFATFHAMRLARRYKAKALFIAWQNIYRSYPPPFSQVEQYNYRHATVAVAGIADAADILKRKGFSGPIRVVPQHGIDPQIYQRSEPRPARAGDAPFVLGYVGRLKEEKGLPLLIEVLASLPDYCRVVFVGTGPVKGELEQQALRLGIADRVTFKGAVPTYAVPQEMQRMDAFVLPSLTRPNWKEQFGRVLIEAMACETPVIGSRSGEIPHVIGDAGLLFQEGNVQELAACVRQLLDDPTLYAHLAAKGRQRVLEHYTQERIARQMYEVYVEMMEKLSIRPASSKLLQWFGSVAPREKPEDFGAAREAFEKAVAEEIVSEE
jgi:glycosyltransferase involved in cell wall biosynthesis